MPSPETETSLSEILPLLARLERAALPLLIVLGTIFHLILSWSKSVPLLFPDEYFYPSLARSIGHGHLAIRGQHIPFRAVLDPILTSPIWSLAGPETAYRLVQGLQALVASLAVWPVYLLARRLGLSSRLALVSAFLSLIIPELVYTGSMTTEALSYPLFVGAALFGTLSLAEGRRHHQLLFLLFAALSILTRVQMLIVPVAFVLAVLTQSGLERRRQTLREQWLPLLLIVAPALAALLIGKAVLGSYSGTFYFPDLLRLLAWMGRHLYEILWATGLTILPAALLGLALMVYRPAARIERSFAVFAIWLIALLLVAGAYYPTRYPSVPAYAIMHGRYVFYVAPLLFISFAAYLRRGLPWIWGLIALLAGGAIATHYLQLSSYAYGDSESPLLFAVSRLDQALGGQFTSQAYLYGLALLTAIALAVIALGRYQRVWAAVALACAIPILLATSVFAQLHLKQLSDGVVHDRFAQGHQDWVQRAASRGPVSFVALGGLRDYFEMEDQGFWYPSLRALSIGSGPPDNFGYARATISATGALRSDHSPVTGMLLIPRRDGLFTLAGQQVLAQSPTMTLLRGAQPLRVQWVVQGYDAQLGWLADQGVVDVYDRRPGYLVIHFDKPSHGTTLQFHDPQHLFAIKLQPGQPRTVRIPVCQAPWWLHFRTAGTGGLLNGASLINGRFYSARAQPPAFIADPSACSSSNR